MWMGGVLETLMDGKEHAGGGCRVRMMYEPNYHQQSYESEYKW